MSVPYGLAVSYETRSLSLLTLFFKIVFCYSGSLKIPYKILNQLVNFYKEGSWDSERNCAEYAIYWYYNLLIYSIKHDTIYRKPWRLYQKKLLELVSGFSKVPGFKINIQKSVVFLYINNKLSEIKKAIPFIVLSKKE